MHKLANLAVGRLSDITYELGLRNFPIPTVDFVLQRPDKSILLIKRAEGAYEGEWFVLGGRQYRGETMSDALLRVARREVGLTREHIVGIKLSHCQDVFNPASVNSDGPLPAWHSIWHFHVIQVRQDFQPVLDMTSISSAWFDPASALSVPPPVSSAIAQAVHSGALR